MLQAPVQDMRFTLRMNFPSRHPLKMAPTVRVTDADVILGLEHPEFYMNLNSMTPTNRMGMETAPRYKPGTKIATISSSDLLTKSNYQDAGRYVEADLAIPADAEATLPALIEACRRLITPERRRAFDARGVRLAEDSRRAREQALEQASWGWDASPISTARLSAEIWNQIKDEDWSLVSDATFISGWPHRLWDITKHHQYIGWSGAYGIGYGAPAAVGAALANRKHGRLSVNIQCDGDMNYAPAVLWTAAHHRIPLLTVMHNNRAYHQERMFVVDMAARANRDVGRAGIGNDLSDPNIDYAIAGQGLRRLRHRADHESQRPGSGAEARHRGGEARRARARGRRDASALTEEPLMPRPLLACAAIFVSWSLAAPLLAQTVATAARAHRQRRERQAALHREALLLLPRHRGAGRRGLSAHRARAARRRQLRPLRQAASGAWPPTRNSRSRMRSSSTSTRSCGRCRRRPP